MEGLSPLLVRSECSYDGGRRQSQGRSRARTAWLCTPSGNVHQQGTATTAATGATVPGCTRTLGVVRGHEEKSPGPKATTATSVFAFGSLLVTHAFILRFFKNGNLILGEQRQVA